MAYGHWGYAHPIRHRCVCASIQSWIRYLCLHLEPGPQFAWLCAEGNCFLDKRGRGDFALVLDWRDTAHHLLRCPCPVAVLLWYPAMGSRKVRRVLLLDAAGVWRRGCSGRSFTIYRKSYRMFSREQF
jgi:hypothetical protein